MWPTLQPRLAGAFRKLGVHEVDIEDACHEVVQRLLTSQARFPSARAFDRWLRLVAFRLVSKGAARRARLSDEQVPELLVPDPARVVEARALLSATMREYRAMPAEDRALLAAAVRGDDLGPTQLERDRVSLKVHRLRRRLRTRLRGWWAGMPWWRGRWFVDPAHLAGVPQAVVAVVVVAAAASAWLPADKGTTVTTVDDARHAVVHAVVDDADLGATVESRSHPSPRTRVERSEGHTTPEARPPDGPLDRRVVVTPPAGAPGQAEAEVGPRDPGERTLVCWGDWPVVPGGCVEHPLHEGEPA